MADGRWGSDIFDTPPRVHQPTPYGKWAWPTAALVFITGYAFAGITWVPYVGIALAVTLIVGAAWLDSRANQRRAGMLGSRKAGHPRRSAPPV